MTSKSAARSAKTKRSKGVRETAYRTHTSSASHLDLAWSSARSLDITLLRHRTDRLRTKVPRLRQVTAP